MPQWSNKFSKFEHVSWTDENGTSANDCWSKLNMAEQLAKSTQAALFLFLNTSVVEYNFGSTTKVPLYVNYNICHFYWKEYKLGVLNT